MSAQKPKRRIPEPPEPHLIGNPFEWIIQQAARLRAEQQTGAAIDRAKWRARMRAPDRVGQSPESGTKVGTVDKYIEVKPGNP